MKNERKDKGNKEIKIQQLRGQKSPPQKNQSTKLDSYTEKKNDTIEKSSLAPWF